MIDRLVDAVIEGQPKCRVVGATEVLTREHLMPRVREALKAAGLPIEQRRWDMLLVDGSEVRFVPVSQIQRECRGTQGFGEFWDHWADGIE